MDFPLSSTTGQANDLYFRLGGTFSAFGAEGPCVLSLMRLMVSARECVCGSLLMEVQCSVKELSGPGENCGLRKTDGGVLSHGHSG